MKNVCTFCTKSMKILSQSAIVYDVKCTKKLQIAISYVAKYSFFQLKFAIMEVERTFVRHYEGKSNLNTLPDDIIICAPFSNLQMNFEIFM